MAKTSQRVKQMRTPKYKTQAYTRCNRCGRPRAVYRKFGSAASACASSRTTARSRG